MPQLVRAPVQLCITHLLLLPDEAGSFPGPPTASFLRERFAISWRPEIVDSGLDFAAAPGSPLVSRKERSGVYKLIGTSRGFDAIPPEPAGCRSNRRAIL